MTRERLINCYSVRKELQIVERRLESSGSADLEPQLKERAAALEAELAEVQAFTDSVKNNQARMLLDLRYIEGLKWKDVAALMGYSLKHVCYKNRKIMAALFGNSTDDPP